MELKMNEIYFINIFIFKKIINLNYEFIFKIEMLVVWGLIRHNIIFLNICCIAVLKTSWVMFSMIKIQFCFKKKN